MITVDDSVFYKLSNNRNSLKVIAKLFKSTDEEVDHPNYGEWIADCIKQLKTAQLAVEAFQKRQQKNLSVETYNPNPFENKPNPLLPEIPVIPVAGSLETTT